MKNRIKASLILIIVMILYPIIYNIFFLKYNVYYIIEYDVSVENEDDLINKVERFDYTSHLNDLKGDWQGMKGYIDRTILNDLKENVVNSQKIFQWDFNYKKHLEYYFKAIEISKTYLKYNNNTIFFLKDNNNEIIFSSSNDDNYGKSWYLNFAILPYVSNESAIIPLSNIVFVNISLDYGYYCGLLCALGHNLKQFLILDSNFEVILILIPSVSTWVS